MLPPHPQGDWKNNEKIKVVMGRQTKYGHFLICTSKEMLRQLKLDKQECIPVGCVLPASVAAM